MIPAFKPALPSWTASCALVEPISQRSIFDPWRLLHPDEHVRLVLPCAPYRDGLLEELTFLHAKGRGEVGVLLGEVAAQ